MAGSYSPIQLTYLTRLSPHEAHELEHQQSRTRKHENDCRIYPVCAGAARAPHDGWKIVLSTTVVNHSKSL